jgi:pimeloyl-ACP methyl ester carboxylesterase
MDRFEPQDTVGGLMITNQIESRELFELTGDRVLLRGTFHRAATGNLTQAGNVDRTLGITFLNPMAAPRSLIGDAGAYWATSFASLGYPSFRCDLPGSGDSPGGIPIEFLDFINNGGYEVVTASKIKELTRRFNLSGTVIFGHCAAATTAIYVASECKECKGLILADPYFNVVNNLTPILPPGILSWARRSKSGELLRAFYVRLREARKRFGQGSLPGNANFGLIARWKKVLSSGMPILVLKSSERLGSSKLRAGAFDYLGHIASVATHSEQLKVKTIEDTDHSFANRSGRAAVRSYAEAWLGQHFPLANTGELLRRNLSKEVSDLGPLILDNALSVQVSTGE